MSVILALGMLEWEDREFQASLGYVVGFIFLREEGYQDGLEGKLPATKADNLSSSNRRAPNSFVL